jgi:hypothetical protein
MTHGMPCSPQPVCVPAWGTRTPLYKLLKKSDSFRWTEEAHKAHNELKVLITKPPVLTSPEVGETLFLYIVATTQIISATQVVEREELEHIYNVQRLVYSTKPATIMCKNCFTMFWLRNTSSCTISKVTQSMWSHHRGLGKLLETTSPREGCQVGSRAHGA